MRFNDRSMALLGVPDLPNDAFKHVGDRRIKPQGGGGGGGQPTQTTSTAYQTNIPEYAKPYVETMLGATQKQLFQGTPTADGGFNITGFQPYRAYGGTYDASGNQISYDPSKGIAGFSPMQQAAQQGVAGMQVPGQYGQAMDITGAGVQGAIGTAGQGVGLAGLGYQAAGAGNQYAQQATNPYAMQAYMSPYMQDVVNVQQREAQRQADIASTQRGAQAVQAGAFGGARQGVTDAEAARNLAIQQQNIQAQGLQNAFQQAQQAQQFGAGLGLQGLQAGMGGVGAGIGAQQAAYSQAMQGAGQLANLGQQQLASQQGIYGLQNQYGAQQQALQQQILNQAMQDYANAQQYPLMQLGTMSNMLRGLPMQASTSQQYVAPPSMLTQGIGAIGAGTSLYNAFNPPGRAKGGVISYDVGGSIKSKLYDMDEQGLEDEIQNSSSPSIKRMAQAILREKQIENQQPNWAGGGIVAFKKGDEVEAPASSDDADVQRAQGIMLAAPRPSGTVTENPTVAAGPAPAPVSGDITQAAPPPKPLTPAEAAQASPDFPPYYKAVVQDLSDRMNKPIEDIMAERQALLEKYGVAQRNPEERAKLVSERANLDVQTTQDRWMRAAEFFAQWGSTPGPTIAAGLNALKERVPDMISDDKQAREARMKIDKAIADVDEATRAEMIGRVDYAQALKMKAAEQMQALNVHLITLEVAERKGEAAEKRAQTRAEAEAARQREHDATMWGLRKEIEGMANATTIQAAKINAGVHAAQSKQHADDLAQARLNSAMDMRRKTETDIERLTAPGTKYAYAANLANMPITSSTDPETAAMIRNAKQELEKHNKNIADMRKTADDLVNYHAERAGMTPPKARTSNAAPPPPPPGAKLD